MQQLRVWASDGAMVRISPHQHGFQWERRISATQRPLAWNNGWWQEQIVTEIPLDTMQCAW